MSAPGSRANLRIDAPRLLRRIAALAEIGAIEGGGVCRLALSDEDRQGRDLVKGWMQDLGLTITVDRMGNVFGIRRGRRDGPPVMTGSHIDTVRTGGRYDGNLGVLAGLEVVETLDAAGVETEHPLAVAFFTNEEGARFHPDMTGSLAFAGGIAVDEARATVGIDGKALGAELDRIGYAGDAACGFPVRAFVELHIEQGPVLERDGITIGAVESVQGISWTELTLSGQSAHAGTTPLALRKDAGLVAAEIAVFLRKLALEMGGAQVATVGRLELKPNIINVVPNAALMTVDLRNTDEAALQRAERRFNAFVDERAAREGVTLKRRTLARFEPVTFDAGMVSRVERIARGLGHSVRRMPSGAGHDAQMLQRVCPTGMIFVPSVAGLSHNVRELTEDADIAAGANVLLQVLLDLAD